LAARFQPQSADRLITVHGLSDCLKGALKKWYFEQRSFLLDLKISMAMALDNITPGINPHFSQIFAAIADMCMSTASGSVGYLHRTNSTSPVSSVAFLVSIPICAISRQYL